MSNYGKTAYNERNYDQIHIWIPIGHKKTVEMAAKAAGESLNRYVAAAIEAALERDGIEIANLDVAKMRLDKYEKVV